MVMIVDIFEGFVTRSLGILDCCLGVNLEQRADDVQIPLLT
jgi:hypothetical protein